MAVYAAPAKRRRMTIVIAVLAAVLGLVIGIAIGRGSAPSIDEKIADGRNGGRDLAAALRVLPLEYGQALAGSSETNLIQDTVARSTTKLGPALDGAPWLTTAQRQSVTAAVGAVQSAAKDEVTPKRFEAVIATTTATVQSVFGLPAQAGT